MLVAGLWQWPPWRGGRLGDNVEEWDVELWQELERDPLVRARLATLAHNDACVVEGDDEATAAAA